jgi:hypothetical protein
MNPHYDFLLSVIYDHAALHPEHLADLRKSGITDDTIARQKIRTVMPPAIFHHLLGFPIPAAITSMYVLPFFNAGGGLTDHIRVKVFPSLSTKRDTVKYLQPKQSGVRIYFALDVLDKVMDAAETVWLCEGEKKTLSMAQLGLAAIGICGVEGWHEARSRELHPDLATVPLAGRRVKLLPDGDWQTNEAVGRGVLRCARACEARGARTEVVTLPPMGAAA